MPPANRHSGELVTAVAECRRQFLKTTAAAASSIGVSHLLQAHSTAFGQDARAPIPVAGVATVYSRNSHADVIFGKILEGYRQDGGTGPNLRLASLYIDQPKSSQLGIQMAKKHGVHLARSIDEAVTVATDGVPVRGVISVGEHGNYPMTKDTNQRMYPRRRFFDEIVKTLKRYQVQVPIFSDKHLSYAWADANHMYQTAKRMRIPLMAGSSLPVAWRTPRLELKAGCDLKCAVSVGYGGNESYGFHALEALQCMVERRKGGETGVRAIQAVVGKSITQMIQSGRLPQSLVTSALRAQGVTMSEEEIRESLERQAVVFAIEHLDGFQSFVVMAHKIASKFSFAAQVGARTVSCLVGLAEKHPFGHFAWLVEAIAHMVETGKPAYPVERTLLTTGILDRMMHSLANSNRKYTTPELNIAYQSSGWHFAEGPIGNPPKRVKS